jgi:hypothetical protein
MKRTITSTIFACAVVISACATEAGPEPEPAHIPAHIETWAFDEKFAQGENTSADVVRRLVTYAMGGLGNDKALNDCGNSGKCFSVFYFDPALVYDSADCPFSGDKDVLAAAQENWFIHLPGYDDKAHRVSGTYTQMCKGNRIQVPVYVLNQNQPAVAQYFAGFLQRNADAWNFYEMDDTATTTVDQFYGPGGGFCKAAASMRNGWCTQTREIPDDNALRQAHFNFVAALTHRDGKPMRLFYNGVGFGPEGPRVSLLRNAQFQGAVCEGCTVTGGTLRPTFYAKTLDAMARINEIPNKRFVELTTGSSPAGSDDQIAQRLVTTAVAWLGFSDGHTVVWPDLEANTHNLAVWPEDGIYPAAAMESMHSGARDLEVAPSVWRREFSSCYLDTKKIGPCAAILNGSPQPVALADIPLRLHFSHQVAFVGGDTESGGRLDLTHQSSANVTIAPGHGLLLVR